MSDKQELKVVVSGDATGAKRAFTELTSATQTLGKTVQQETTKASQSTQAMGQTIKRESQEAGRNWSEIGKGVQKVSLALGALTLEATAQSGKNEAAQQRLVGAFENSGQAIEDYEAKLKSAEEAGTELAFGHRDIIDSLAKLESTTKNADQALSDLALAEDIARGANMSLAEATNIVQGAEVGRFRGMLQLGIKLDETATKQDYLTAAQEKYAGASERFATTGAADFERWKNTAEEALVSVGTHLSAVQGPLLALSAGGTIFGELGHVLKETGAAAAVADVALGPVGLAAAVIAAGAAFVLLTDHTSGWQHAADAATQSGLSLKDAIARLAEGGAGGEASALNEVDKAWEDLATNAAENVKRVSDLNDQILALQIQLDERRQSPVEMSPEEKAYADDLQKQIDALEAERVAFDKLSLSSKNINQITNDILDFFQKPLTAAEKAAGSKDLEYYFQLFEDGAITQAQLVDYVHRTDTEWTKYNTTIIQTAESQAALNNMMLGTASTLVANSSLLGNLTDAQRAHMIQAGHAVVQENNLADAFGDAAASAEGPYMGALRAAGDTGAGFIQVVDAQIAKLKEYQDALGMTPQLADTHAAALAGHAQAAGTALGDTFRVAVSNTSQIGSQAQGVADWADKLIGVKGQYAEIDKLLAKGTISQAEYNRAQSAETSILHENAAIQRDVQKIQVDQAPIIARMTKAEREYLDQLAQEPAQQQMATLGYMDQAESARALELQQLALSAATGELGKSGEKTASSMITAAAEADPYLQAMLVDMGLITVGADGTITVNFGDVTDAHSETQDLIDAVDRLSSDLEEIYHLDVDSSDAATANARLETTVALLNNLNGSSATFYVNQVSSGISLGNPSGPSILPSQLGGVLSYARGGVIAELAEAGPELLHFAGGGTAWAMNRGLYSVPNNTYVSPANVSKPGPGAIHLHNPVINIYPQPGSNAIQDITEAAYGSARQ